MLLALLNSLHSPNHSHIDLPLRRFSDVHAHVLPSRSLPRIVLQDALFYLSMLITAIRHRCYHFALDPTYSRCSSPSSLPLQIPLKPRPHAHIPHTSGLNGFKGLVMTGYQGGDPRIGIFHAVEPLQGRVGPEREWNSRPRR